MNEFKKFAGNCRELVRKKIFIYFRSGFEFEICIKAVESFRCLQQPVSLFHQNGEASASRRPQVLREVHVKGTKLERKLRFNFLDSEYIFSNRSLKCVAGIVADDVKKKSCYECIFRKFCHLAYQGQAKGLGPCGGMSFKMNARFFFIFQLYLLNIYIYILYCILYFIF